MNMKVKKMLAIILAIATIFSVTVPAMAETAQVSLPVNSSVSEPGTDSAQAASSITIPLTFDGSNPDSSQVVVEKAQDTSTNKNVMLASGSGGTATTTTSDRLPQRVETTVSTTSSSITLVTADKYFLYTPTDGVQQCPFAVEFEGLPTADYFVTLASSESTTDAGIKFDIYQHDDIYYFGEDIKSIISDVTNPATIYLSVWQTAADVETKLYGPTAVSVNYVENNVETVPDYYKYISSDSDSTWIELRLPGKNVVLANNSENPNVVLSLVDSVGNVVVKNVKEINDYVSRGYYDNQQDQRYKAVFEGQHLPTNYSYVSVPLYRAASLTPGSYGLKLSINDIVTTYPDMIQVVDGPIVKQIYNNSVGFPSAVIGGNEAYAFVTMEGAEKDDFDVSILDGNKTIIGSCIKSKHITNNSNTVAYKLQLNADMKFESGKNYFINLTYKSGTMYYAGSAEGLYVTSNFDIYSYSFYDGNTVADFNFKAVNIPSDTTTQIELGLFSNNNVVLGTAKVTPTALMSHVQFTDTDGKVVSLNPGTSYVIKEKITFPWGGEYWSEIFNIYIQSARSTSNTKASIERWGAPYFYIGDTVYDFDIGLPKALNKITDSSTFVVKLKNAEGVTVGNESGETIKEDVTINYSGDDGEKDVPTVSLIGKLALPVSGLTEGIYSLEVEITGVASVQTRISGLSADKIYAYSSYPSLEATESGYKIDGYAYMLKSDQSYNESKFKYEMTDLLGNSIAVGPATATLGNTWTYEAYYNIDATITNSLPPAYYFLKLKYDEKDIYDLYNPLKLLFSGNNAVDNIPTGTRFQWSSDGTGDCAAIYLSGKVTETDVITAIIYDPDDKENFSSVKELTLIKDPDTSGRYIFSVDSLAAIDGNKEFDIIFLQNGKYLGSLDSLKIAGANIQLISATGITLNTTSAAITVGNTQTLVAKVTPNNATGNIVWTTSNANVASVANGVVTAISAGTATITARVDGKSATCYVVVSNASTPSIPSTSGGTQSGNGVVVPTPIISTTETNPVTNTDSSGKAVVKAEQLGKAESLTIKGETTLTFDKAAIEALKGLTGDIAITIKKADVVIPAEMKTIIGDRPVYEFTVTAGGKTISDFKGGSIKIEVPYIAKDNEDVNAIVIYFIDAEGKLNIVNSSIYDPATKKVIFTTTHFSKYAVGYNKVEYTDVSGWATNAINYISARGIISGVGDNKYAPANKINRADFAVALARIAGADLSKYTKSRFEDVKVSDSYAKAIEWAADNGIVSGVGKGKYGPKALITRQEMAVMITKLAKVMKYTLPTTVAKADFSDQKAISSYALDAAKGVQMAGIISGKVKGEKKEFFFAPKDNATRAETAQMLYSFIKGTVK